MVVVCNGCADDTAVMAGRRVTRCGSSSSTRRRKPAALRAGDEAADVLPRIYLDADVVLAGAAARAVLERLRAGAVAARPPIRYDSGRSSAPVRRYYRARSRVPALLDSLWGAGVYGLSEAGRSRFGAFPDIVADDLWVDRHFAPGEIEIVDCAPVVGRGSAAHGRPAEGAAADLPRQGGDRRTSTPTSGRARRPRRRCGSCAARRGGPVRGPRRRHLCGVRSGRAARAGRPRSADRAGSATTARGPVEMAILAHTPCRSCRCSRCR